MGVSGNVKSFLGRVELWKINKNIQDTLSLRVARSGTKKSVSFMSFVNSSQFNLRYEWVFQLPDGL